MHVFGSLLCLIIALFRLISPISSMAVTRVPKLIAFDLDGTVWSPDMYMLWGGGSPFTRHDDNTLSDRGGSKVKLLGATAKILDELKQPPYTDTKVAWVSCTDEPTWAAECLDLFTTSSGAKLSTVPDSNLNKIFKANKRVHFEQLQRDTGISYKDMIFFDNESGNIDNVSKLGVTAVYCPKGMTQEVWELGLRQFSKGASS